MQNIVVTGANCFIAKPLIKLLSQKGYHIYAVVRDGSSYVCEDVNVQMIHLNFDEYYKLADIISQPCFAFFNFTWDGTRGESRNDELRQLKNYENSILTYNTAKILGCEYFVGAGSQAEYGVLNKKISETDQPEPNTAYGRYKLLFTNYLQSQADVDSIKFLMPRFFSLYGYGDYKNTLVEMSINKMLNNEDCDYTQAIQNWNYLYIDDCVKALVYLMENGFEGVFNFGSTETYKLKDYVKMIKSVLGSKSKLNFGAIPYPSTGMVSIDPDISKLIQTGFNEFTPFCEGIRKIVELKIGNNDIEKDESNEKN